MDIAALVLLLSVQAAAWPVDSRAEPAKTAGKEAAKEENPAKQPLNSDGKMPLTGLAPSHTVANLCVYQCPVSTLNAECQAHVDQGLGYFYSYVWMEATRSFETACRLDPDCAMAWLFLGRACEKWGPADKHKNTAFKKAGALRDKADPRERLLIKAYLLERGLEPGAGDGEARKKAAIKQVDELLAQFPEDQEAWYERAQLAAGGMFGGNVAGAPFYHALLGVNPLHPGANHELVHFYESIQRPSLGWKFANKYIESSPGIPHPHHMQAHLATRLGRWDKTALHSAIAAKLEAAYHLDMAVLPKDDHQYSHHLEILMVSLAHDGRFETARRILQQTRDANFDHQLPWFRLAMVSHDASLAQEVVATMRKRDKAQAAWMGALWAWRSGDIGKLVAEVEVLRQIRAGKKEDRKLDLMLWEAQGLLACEQGDGAGGLKLLKRCVDKTKDDFSHHAWGNGAAHMLTWGLGALRVGDALQGEEAFLEALAHDPGNAAAALGLRILAELAGDTAKAESYAALAKRLWARADRGALEDLEGWLRGLAAAGFNRSPSSTVSRK